MTKDRIYIIAEAGVNHNGSLDIAKDLVEAAASAGADAIKFQTFKTELLLSENAPKAEYQIRTTGFSESQYSMLKKLELSEKSHHVLFDYCKIKGIQFLSTPFDSASLDLLARTFNLPCLKLPSGEITNAPFLLEAALTGKPIIMSTGMSTLSEIRTALGVLAFGYTDRRGKPSLAAFEKARKSEKGRAALKQQVTLLHCTTEYPAKFGDVNLLAMETMRAAFSLPVGFSDHTAGIAISVAAAALGAVVVEKHFTLDRNLPGPDHKASLEPDELTAMVRAIREVELALGTGKKTPAPGEQMNIPNIRRSLVAGRSIRKGEPFSPENLVAKRPGTGLSPFLYWDMLGKKSVKDYQKDELIKR